jgi:hypothetical protein
VPQTFALSTIADPTGKEVARMLRVAADRIEQVDARVEHVHASSESVEGRGLVHSLRFFWED